MKIYYQSLRFLKINFLFLWFSLIALYVIQIAVMSSNPEYGTGDWGSNVWVNGIQFVINDSTAAGINVLLMMILLWMLLIITNRVPVTLIIATVMTTIAAIAEYQLINTRQEAITEASLQEITAIGDLLGMLDIKLVISAIAFLILTLILLVIVYRRNKWIIFRSIRWRALLFVISIITLLPFLSINSDKYEDTFNKLGDVPKVWDSLFDAASNGGIVALLNSRTTDAMVEPKNYSQQAMKNLVTKYTKQSVLINQTRKNTNFKNQTVIYTLSESLTKPSYVPGLTISDDPLPNIDNVMDNTSSGHMVSSGYGGGTAGIEYSTLTGFNITSYRPTVTMPYSQLTSSINEKSTITGQFDNKIVVHPYVGSFYNRRAVYKNMGINYFYTTDSAVPVKYQKTIDGDAHISDESAYKNVLSKISKKNNSQFIQLLTMQNHTPWTFEGRDYNMIEPTNSNADENTIESYLQGLHYTDEATQTFLDKLNELSRPITLVWYGDHWPGIFNFVNTTTDALSAHSTPYFIWQNDAAKKANGTVNVSANYADPSDFTAMMMKMNGMKVDAYWALKTEMLEKVPTINNYTRDDKGKLTFLDQQGNKIDEKSLTKDQQEIVNDFKLVQYDITTGKSYLLKTNFFQKVK
ncbi:LTA synthase family protein [Leuconostoc pseudomesenteroides]|nr:LTA synthase family protein [Leuconostoc pseudomesenteroides]MCC8439356.1 phosphoglycerol transferase [Leuconostoc pseudomesenteroides]NKZ36180.1 LTA synthase family protein [Leuconostoc pseudomesenteroides]QEA43087.1 LTA synthase family protein [Leuconostoc pseudomesenteroides]QQB28422.1 LTA synthase family protein [Leuconostoc pseudomesenteroides]